MNDLISRLRDLHMQCDGLSLYAEAADEIERLRAALTELVACHTESAGWTVEMLSNRAEFDAMLNRSQERVESAVGAACAALKEST